MSVEKTNVVDAIGLDKATGRVVLTVADYLDWETHEADHLAMLEAKLNAYLRFIATGELLQAYPDARGRQPVISIVVRCELTAGALRFLVNARQSIERAGFGFQFEQFKGQSNHVGE